MSLLYVFVASSFSFFFFLDEILHVKHTTSVFTDFINSGWFLFTFLYKVCIYDINTPEYIKIVPCLYNMQILKIQRQCNVVERGKVLYVTIERVFQSHLKHLFSCVTLRKFLNLRSSAVIWYINIYFI